MTFRPPAMTYTPRKLEGWERFIAFTLVTAPFEAVQPAIAGVVRHRDGPMSKTEGEHRPPLMAMEQTPGQEFNGTLVWSPAEMPSATVIEHPLDEVAPEDFPASLTKVLPEATLVTFWSTLDTTIRQEHGYKVLQGGEIIRRALITRGYDSGHWEWHETGEPQDFENTVRLAEKRVWRRLDRKLVFDYAAALGLDPDRSLFGRDFARSVFYAPLPYTKPETVAKITTAYAEDADHAALKMVKQVAPNVSDAEFEIMAKGISSIAYWDVELSAMARKAWDSSERAKTQKGRERAQWRVVEGLRRWRRDMEALGMTKGLNMFQGQFNHQMKALGTDTEAYRAYRAIFPNRSAFWW